MTPITTRTRVAAAVAALRQTDAQLRTDTAISTVAEITHLPAADVARIAAEESHADALRENQRLGIADVAARSIGITPEIADATGCRGCGACACGRQTVEA